MKKHFERFPFGCSWKPIDFIKKHEWPSKDARGPAHHFAGRTGSIGQDVGGVETSLKVLPEL